MPASRSELHTLAHRLQSSFGTTETAVACLVHLSESMLRRLADQHDSNLEPLIHLQRRMAKAWCGQHDVGCDRVRSAVQGLKQAGSIAGYLHTVPD